MFAKCIAVLLCLLVALPAAAQWKPAQTVDIVVGTSAGSGSDRTARLIQRILQERKLIDTPSVVSNRAGGGGTIALTFMTQQPGNGHFLMVTSPSMLTNHITGRTALSHADTTPLAQLGAEYVVFAVRADSPIRTAKDIADRMKTDVASLSFAIGVAVGSHNHIAVAQVAKAMGGDVRKLRVVAFSGSADGITAAIGGHVDVTSSPAGSVLPHVQAGRLRVVVASADQRLTGPFAAVPTWKELGVPAVASNWRSVVGPRGLSVDQVRYWDQVFAQVAKAPEWLQDLESSHVEATYLNAAATRKLMDSQLVELRTILGDLGLAK